MSGVGGLGEGVGRVGEGVGRGEGSGVGEGVEPPHHCPLQLTSHLVLLPLHQSPGSMLQDWQLL